MKARPIDTEAGLAGQRPVVRAVQPLVLLVALLALWELTVWLGVLPSYTLAAPSDIVTYISANTDKLFRHTGVTVREMLGGFALGVTLGILFGVLTTQFRVVENALLPLLVVTQTIPSVAIAPLLVLLLGFGMMPKIILAAIISFFPVLINTIAGLRSLDEDAVDLSRVLRVSRVQFLRRFAIPAALPYIFAGARVAATLSLIGAVVGEFVTANAGLGYLVLQGSNNFDAEQVFATIVFLAALGIAAFTSVRVVERLLVPWANRTNN